MKWWRRWRRRDKHVDCISHNHRLVTTTTILFYEEDEEEESGVISQLAMLSNFIFMAFLMKSLDVKTSCLKLKIEIGSSLQHLLELNHLEHLDVIFNNLDVIFNNFTHSKIPKFTGSMKQLMYLNLSHGYFHGVVPHHLGDLTRGDCICGDVLGSARLTVNNTSDGLTQYFHIE